MAYHAYSEQFRAFFRRLNPGSGFERTAASEYATVKALIENRSGPARTLSPVCFLQGSYRQQTAIYTINDVDILALCHLWQPGSGSGPSWTRNEIFDTIAAPLLGDSRYRNKVRYSSDSLCIKVDLGIRLEILPVVYKAGTSDPGAEPFRLFRPESSSWEDGFARYHQQWLTWKNGPEHADGNFIPAVKVFKHLRSRFNVDAVSFHLECLLFSLPDSLFQGGPADYIPALLEAIASVPAVDWYVSALRTPCKDRDIFVSTEWSLAKWVEFHELLTLLAPAARAACQMSSWDAGIVKWQAILGAQFFPKDPAT
jgi:hypothetical protein